MPHVVGVVTEHGDELRADLVVDAGGTPIGAPAPPGRDRCRPPVEELADCGFVYYGRHFRSADGSLPPAFGPGLMPHDSVSILTLPADNGTWGVGLVTSAADPALRETRRPGRVDACRERGIRSSLTGSTASPITGVEVMAKIEDRHRAFVVDGVPVVTGVVRSATHGRAPTRQSAAARRSVCCTRASSATRCGGSTPGAALDFAIEWHEVTNQTVEPYFRDTLEFDRHRLAEIDAQIAGMPYETDDPGWLLGQAIANAAMQDPELLRGFVEIVSLLARGVDVLSRPGVAERALELGAEAEPLPGPTRAELLALVAG